MVKHKRAVCGTAMKPKTVLRAAEGVELVECTTRSRFHRMMTPITLNATEMRNRNVDALNRAVTEPVRAASEHDDEFYTNYQ